LIKIGADLFQLPGFYRNSGHVFQRISYILLAVDLSSQSKCLMIGLYSMERIARIMINCPNIIGPFEFAANISKSCGAYLCLKKLLQRLLIITQLKIGRA